MLSTCTLLLDVTLSNPPMRFTCFVMPRLYLRAGHATEQTNQGKEKQRCRSHHACLQLLSLTYSTRGDFGSTVDHLLRYLEAESS